MEVLFTVPIYEGHLWVVGFCVVCLGMKFSYDLYTSVAKIAVEKKIAKANEVRKVYKKLDSTKRRSLQPGTKKTVDIPEGWIESDIDQIVKDKPRAKPTPYVPKEEQKTRQPGVEPYDHKKAAVANRDINHIFFGSELSVGGVTVVRGLGRTKHLMEITKSNQLFIDSTLRSINSDTLMKVKKELFKIQNELR